MKEVLRSRKASRILRLLQEELTVSMKAVLVLIMCMNRNFGGLLLPRLRQEQATRVPCLHVLATDPEVLVQLALLQCIASPA
jgi:hypothetical protein